MSLRIEEPGTRVDRAVQALAAATVALTVALLLLLVRDAVGGQVGHVTVHVDNRAGLELALHAADGSGDTLALPPAKARSLTRIDGVADQGRTWTFVAAYGGREVFRQTLTRARLASQGWRVEVPATATADLERAGFR